MGSVARGFDVVIVLSVLLLEDRDEDAVLVERALRGTGYAYTLKRARNRAQFAEQLDAALDLILSDFHLPDFDALGALDYLKERGLDIPLILVSGEAREEEVLAAVRAGAADFLSKDRLVRLGAVIRSVLEQRALRQQAHEVQLALERNRQELDFAFENAAIGIALTTLDGRWLRVNPAFARLTGYTEAEVLATDCRSLTHPEDAPRDSELLEKLVAGELDTTQHEKRYVHKLGHAVWVQETTSLVRDREGRPRHCMLQVFDMTQRKEVEGRLQALFEQAAVGIAHTTPEGTILEANRKLAELLGYSAQALRGMTTRELTHPEDRDRQDALRLELISGARRSFSGERRYVRADGRVIWVQRTVMLARPAAGHAPYLVQVFEDITERKLAEQALRDSERRYAELVDSVEGIVWEGDPRTFQFTFVSRQAERLLGYPLERWLKEPTFWRDHLHPDDREWAVAYCMKSTAEGRSHDFEYRMIAADGRVVWLRDLVNVTVEDGRPVRMQGVMVDITAAKQTEEHLRRANRARRVLAECSHALVYASSEQELLQAMCRIVVESGGYKMAWVGLPTGDSARPIRPVAHAGYEDDAPMTGPVAWDSAGSYRGFMREVITSGVPHIARDILNNPAHAQRRARARQHGFQSSIALPLENGGAILGAVAIYAREPDAFDEEEIALLKGLAEDIAFGLSSLRERAARRSAEASLRESEQRLREIFEHAAVGLARVDLDGVLLEVNQKFCDLLGYTREELLGKTVEEITHPEDYGKGARYREELAQGTTRPESCEHRFLRKDGTAVWVRCTLSSACDQAGRPKYVIGVVEDITERKEAEERYRATFDHAPIGIMHTALDDYRILHVNPKLCEMLGYTREELLAMTSTDIAHPNYRFKDRPEYMDRMLRGEIASFSSERVFVRKDGTPLWVNRTVALARDGAGNPLHFIRIVEDVSERKRAEEAIARERALLRTIIDALPDYIFVKDRDGQFLLANESWLRVRGMKGDEIVGKTVYDVFPREMAENMAAQDERVVATGEPLLDHETMVAVKDAESGKTTYRWSLTSKVPLRDASGAIIGTVGIARDITERRLAEQALRESEERFRAIFEQAGVGIALRAIEPRNPRWLRVNQKLADIFGYTREELLELTSVDLTPPEERALAIEFNERLARGELTSYSREKRYVRKDGRVIWARVSLAAVRGADGRPASVVSVIQDVTEQVIAARRRAMQSAVTDVLAEAATVEEAMPRIVQAVCEAMDWAYGAWWFWSEEQNKLVRTGYWCAFEPQFEECDREYWFELGLGGGGGLVRRVWRDKEVVWLADLEQQESFLRRASCAKLGWRSAYAFPILAGTEVIGVLEFFGRDSRLPGEALAQVTLTVGSQIGQFIQRKRAEEALRESEETFRAMFDQASVGITVTGLDLRFLQVNDRYCELIGYCREELLRMSVHDVNLPEYAADEAQYRQKLLRGEVPSMVREKPLRRKNGLHIWVSIVTSIIRDSRGAPKHFISVIQDITERKRAEEALRESEEQFRQLADNIPQVFWISDAAQKRTLYLSPAAQALLGRPLEELLSRPRLLVRAVHPEDRPRVHAARKSAASGDYDLTYRVVRPDGTVRWVQDRAFPVRDAAGRIYRIAGIAEDVTERKLVEERLLHLAHYDVLTSLPNRVLFYDRLKQALAQARRNQWTVGVMFIDLDRFKNVNDTLGHTVGDRLLQQVSERLARAVRTGDTVGRLGGDEFAVVLSNLASAQDASLVAQKIMANFNEPFELGGTEIYVTASIGITLYPDDTTDQDTLIKNADTAMYRAKELGRNSYQFYTPEVNARTLELLGMENSLRRALDRGEFLLHYQPKASIAEGEIVGVEALLRWKHPVRGMVSPAEFMPVLEETGIIVPVGNWVLGSVCAQIKAWERAGIRPVPVAVNLSGRQFADRDLGATIKRIIEDHRVDPRLIELEITESSLMVNTEEAVKVLKYLSGLGVRLSIDDFGTGYSSLAYLKRFPLDALKIDRSFVSNLTTDTDDSTITRAVISMAHSLGLKVVAEGVETESQLAFLSEYGCDEIQGYYFARPMPAQECGAWLKEDRRLKRARPGPDSDAPLVLLVDDDEDALALLRRSLAKDGYRILAARNAREALELLGEQPVDVVITDQSMPGMPGVEFLQRVKALSPRTVRMMTSGYTDFQAVTDAVNKGEIFRFLPKTLSEERLRADVREALQLRLQATVHNGRPA